ncbi:hypothetical protein CB1_000151010 [Camelus ferus]|nr:hypothetical protein CB1_000151010 [Camelus ferus]
MYETAKPHLKVPQIASPPGLRVLLPPLVAAIVLSVSTGLTEGKVSAAEDQGTPLDPAAPTGALQAPQAVAIAAPVTFGIQKVVLLNEEQNRLFTDYDATLPSSSCLGGVCVVCVTLQDSLVSLIYKTRAVPTGHSPENRAELLSILEDGKAGPACSQLFPTAAPRLGSEKKPAGALTSTEHQPHFCTGCFHMHDLTESSGHPPPSAGARKAHFMGEAAGRVCGSQAGLAFFWDRSSALCQVSAGPVFLVTRCRARRMFEGEMASLTAILETGTVRVPKPIKVLEAPGGGSVLVMEHLDMQSLSSHAATLGAQLADLHLENRRRGEALHKEAGTVEFTVVLALRVSSGSLTFDNPRVARVAALLARVAGALGTGDQGSAVLDRQAGLVHPEPYGPVLRAALRAWGAAEDETTRQPSSLSPTGGSSVLPAQVNDWQQDWVTFYARQRIQPQIDMLERGSGDREARELWSALQLKIPDLFRDLDIVPALLHGDLWGGNVAEDASGPIIFDPASFYGHSEYELAIAGMFGGFSSNFYSAYHRQIPRAPGFQQRLQLYQLFHHLNHWNHFGSGYRGSSLSIMRDLVR